MAIKMLDRPPWRNRTNVDHLTQVATERAEHLAKKRFTKLGTPQLAHKFAITQGSYQPPGGGDPNSVGTHDGGGVIDIRWCGHQVCLWALRKAGFAAWLRTPAQGPWAIHVHGAVIDHPRLSSAAARQVIAYRAGRNGLANNGPDDGPRLKAIKPPVYPWPKPKTRQKVKKAIKRLKQARQLLRQARAESTDRKQRRILKRARKRTKKTITTAKKGR